MTASEAPLLYALADSVATVTLNRPARLNALTPDMLLELPRLLERAATEGARAVVLTGTGRAFCSGADLDGNQEGPRDLRAAVEGYYNPLARAFAHSPLPIVTAVNGGASGAGASLALWGDIVVAAQSSYLLLAFANIGLVPDAGASWLIAKSAGRVRAMEMALLAERMPAPEALAAGLFTRVVEDDAVLDTARTIAAKLAAKPPIAMRLIRKMIQVGLDDGLEAALAAEAEHQGFAGSSEDFAEGIRAFLEKRKPIFTGK